jgi:hypothetical protein
MVRLSGLRSNFALAALALGVLFLPVSGMSQGFGNPHRKVVLVRDLPPNIRLTGTAFRVDATSTADPDIAASLKSMLESEMTKDDPRLRVSDDAPQTIITLTVTNYSPAAPEVITVPGFQVGGVMAQSENRTRVTGQLSVAFQVKDSAAGRTLDSDNITAAYKREYTTSGGEQGSTTSQQITSSAISVFRKFKNAKTDTGKDDPVPSPEAVRGKLLSNAVLQIASHMVNTHENVDAMLARGKLDDDDRLAEGKEWTRYVEALETMTPLPTGQDAYRLYNIGVGYEAEAYLADTPDKARKYLDQAAINYGKAIDERADEKYFIEPQQRIETAIAHYKTLSDQSAAVTSAASAPAAPEPLNNDQVIQLIKAGVDVSNVIDSIKTAPAVDFDLSVQGTINLTKNGITGPVLSAMKARARQPSKPGAK